MSEFLIPLIILLVGLGATVMIFQRLLKRQLKDFLDGQTRDQGMLLLNQNIHGMQERLDGTTRAIGDRLDNAARVVASLERELGKVQEMGRGMQSLQDFLKSPKLRGNIGEQVLRDLLEQYFPRAHFEIQYKFKTGAAVDAILKTDKGLIPIDAKFPLENFQKFARAERDEERAIARSEFLRDVKKHVQDISKKYILPSEGTVDFAVMYVPAEAIYYEIVRDDADINSFANERKVFIVSPNSFYYFLKVVMIGMEGKRLEENIAKVREVLIAIHQDASKFGEHLGILSTHVQNSWSALQRVNSEYAKLEGKIEQVKLLK